MQQLSTVRVDNFSCYGQTKIFGQTFPTIKYHFPDLKQCFSFVQFSKGSLQYEMKRKKIVHPLLPQVWSGFGLALFHRFIHSPKYQAKTSLISRKFWISEARLLFAEIAKNEQIISIFFSSEKPKMVNPLWRSIWVVNSSISYLTSCARNECINYKDYYF